MISLVPKSGAAGIVEKLFPPSAVRLGARPFHEGGHVAPVLAHADVHREKGIEQIFVAEQAVGFGSCGIGDLGAETEESLDSRQTIDSHAQINDDKFRVRGKIDGLAINLRRHKSSHHEDAATGSKISPIAGKLD